MTGVRRFGFAFAGAWMGSLSGCDAARDPPAPAVVAADTTPAEPIAKSGPQGRDDRSPTVASSPAPAPAGAAIDDDARKLAVLDVLGGRIDAEALPLADLDPGAAFDAGLRDRLAPREVGQRAPRVRQGKATVKGDLDPDLIRRIVRSHINEIRYCYNQGLALDPALGGRVEIEFVIEPDGTVSRASVEESTIPDEAVAPCMTKAVLRWKFPKPDGGSSVLVGYPFVLEAG